MQDRSKHGNLCRSMSTSLSKAFSVRRVGSGPLFYNLDETPRANVDPLKPSRSRAATARAHLSDWVRELGVKDPEVSLTHAWRHTFNSGPRAMG
jgi:hypothetical protein